MALLLTSPSLPLVEGKEDIVQESNEEVEREDRIQRTDEEVEREDTIIGSYEEDDRRIKSTIREELRLIKGKEGRCNWHEI